MGKTITTVRGEIAPADLGVTSMHEHLNAELELLTVIALQHQSVTPPPEMLTLTNTNLNFLRSGAAIFSREAMTIGDVDYTVAELEHFRNTGGGSVVDASPIGLRGDVTQLRQASERSGVHVVCASGLYTAHTRPASYHNWTEEQQVEHFRREVTEGIEGSDVRAGILKCALSATSPDSALPDVELATLRACARVAAETGVSLHVHSAFPMRIDHVLQGVGVIVDDMGLPAERVVMMHMDSFLRSWDSRLAYIRSDDQVKSVDTDSLARVLDTGVTIGFDSWGSQVEILPQDDDRLKGLVHLVRRGYDGQIILGHDITQKPEGISYGGHGFSHFPRLVGSAFAQLGIGEDIYQRLVVENPARVLSH